MKTRRFAVAAATMIATAPLFACAARVEPPKQPTSVVHTLYEHRDERHLAVGTRIYYLRGSAGGAEIDVAPGEAVPHSLRGRPPDVLVVSDHDVRGLDQKERTTPAQCCGAHVGP